MLQKGGKSHCSSDIEILAMLLAAAIHDMGHPGRTSIFQVKARTEIAMQYDNNATTLLEKMHVDTAFDLFWGEEKNSDWDILEFLTKEEETLVKSLIEYAVYGTDMSRHFRIMEDLTNLLRTEAH